MTLWLARHARPRIEAGLCYGRLDVAADPEHTRACARRLLDALPAELEVWHSPLQRCEQLAQELRWLRADRGHKTALQADPRLAEMDFGDWEGRPWAALGEPALSAWTADFAHHRPGGGETLAQVLARVAQALAAARTRVGPDRLWITHAGVIRAVDWLEHHPTRLPTAAEWPVEAPGFGEWRRLSV